MYLHVYMFLCCALIQFKLASMACTCENLGHLNTCTGGGGAASLNASTSSVCLSACVAKGQSGCCKWANPGTCTFSKSATTATGGAASEYAGKCTCTSQSPSTSKPTAAPTTPMPAATTVTSTGPACSCTGITHLFSCSVLPGNPKPTIYTGVQGPGACLNKCAGGLQPGRGCCGFENGGSCAFYPGSKPLSTNAPTWYAATCVCATTVAPSDTLTTGPAGDSGIANQYIALAIVVGVFVATLIGACVFVFIKMRSKNKMSSTDSTETPHSNGETEKELPDMPARPVDPSRRPNPRPSSGPTQSPVVSETEVTTLPEPKQTPALNPKKVGLAATGDEEFDMEQVVPPTPTSDGDGDSTVL